MTITLQPSVLQWARQRAQLTMDDCAKRFGNSDAEKWIEKITKWEEDGVLTYRQAEKLAKVTRTPFGYLFLNEPPAEKTPISDFRTTGSKAIGQISPELRDVIYQSQHRQDWYRDYLKEEGAEPLAFVGSHSPKLTPKAITAAAAAMHETLRYRPSQSTESQLARVIREFADAIEASGILVVRAGKVGNNTRRLLDPGEFRGFALADEWAPLIFVNATDSKAAQIFTLAHELAHIWAGQSAISNLERLYSSPQKVEQFCNAVAAEFLMPLDEVKSFLKEGGDSSAESVRELRLKFRVSDLVVIRRLYDAGALTKDEFQRRYDGSLQEAMRRGGGSGGDFHNNQPGQIGRRFGTALIGSTLEGKTPYRDALSLLDMKKMSSFKTFAQKLDFQM